MKFTYDSIKENLRIYNQAKELIPVISEFELGNMSYNSMRSLGLDQFAEFYNFLKSQKDLGFDLISAISYKELKSLLSQHTEVDRFKTYFNNRTQPQFKKLLNDDSETLDRLLNGRWISKPNYRRRGRRSNEKASGLDICFIPLINWIISNDIEVSTKKSDTYNDFLSQEKYQKKIMWFTGVHLDLDRIPKREIDVTYNLLGSLVDFLSESKMDFRKLNSDFLIENIQSKLRKLMVIPKGTIIKSLVDVEKSGYKELTKDATYTVEDSTISYGFLRVWIQNDRGNRNYYDYKLFEDLSIHRDLLLQQLGF